MYSCNGVVHHPSLKSNFNFIIRLKIISFRNIQIQQLTCRFKQDALDIQVNNFRYILEVRQMTDSTANNNIQNAMQKQIILGNNRKHFRHVGPVSFFTTCHIHSEVESVVSSVYFHFINYQNPKVIVIHIPTLVSYSSKEFVQVQHLCFFSTKS